VDGAGVHQSLADLGQQLFALVPEFDLELTPRRHGRLLTECRSDDLVVGDFDQQPVVVEDPRAFPLGLHDGNRGKFSWRYACDHFGQSAGHRRP
jgi:hypothetical protein